MITANELRIGNWVSNGHQNYAVDANMIYDIDAFSVRFDPIPLTPELLKTCGFKQGYRSTLFLEYGYLVASYARDEVFHQIEVNDLTYDTHQSVVKYLHQLQNLYFALTGSE